MEKQLIEESPDGVATLTFNRPDRLNALLTINSNGRSVDVHAMFSLESTSNGRRVSVHWFAGVLQSLCSPS